MENNLTSFCSNCSNELSEDDIFCKKCGFPERGTNEQKESFLANLNKEKAENQTKKRLQSIRIAKYTLFAVAGINLLGGIVVFAQNSDLVDLLLNLLLTLIYAGLAIWANKKTLIAVSAGFIMYLAVNIINGIISPDYILRGIFIKAILIFAFLKAIFTARKLNNS